MSNEKEIIKFCDDVYSYGSGFIVSYGSNAQLYTGHETEDHLSFDCEAFEYMSAFDIAMFALELITEVKQAKPLEISINQSENECDDIDKIKQLESFTIYLKPHYEVEPSKPL